MVSVSDLENESNIRPISTEIFEAFQQSVLYFVTDGIIIFDQKGTIHSVNESAESMFGYCNEELLNKDISILVPRSLHKKWQAYFTKFLSPQIYLMNMSVEFDAKGRHRNGSTFSLYIKICVTQIADRSVLIGLIKDRSQNVKEQSTLLNLSSVLEQTADSVIITNNRGKIEYVNPAFEKTTGYSRQEAIGRNPNIVKSQKHEPEFYKKLWKTILNGSPFRDVFINKKKNNELYYEEKTITPVRDPITNKINHFVSTGKDITKRIQTEERLNFLVHYDFLTNLPNRNLFLERVNHGLIWAERNKSLLAIIIVDFDHFMAINETKGYEIGDAIIVEFVKRLLSVFRKMDTVARVRGDTFAILIENLTNSDLLLEVVQKIYSTLEKPFEADTHELFMTASIGLSLYPNDGSTTAELLRNAESAMGMAKHSGRNNYQFYTVDMTTKAVRRFDMEVKLRKAIEKHQFILYYQPQYDLVSGEIVAFEALVRWQHPDQGLVLPSDFIPVLEDTGLIVPVGQWVLEEACRQIQFWSNKFNRSVRIAVNLSALQIHNSSLVENISRTLNNSGICPNNLELELTESSIMQDVPATIEKLVAISSMGIQLAVDDFGTGYSCMNYLKQFPVHKLKLDRSFVQDLPKDKKNAGIARAVIALAHNLGLLVVAEGVETEENKKFLQLERCDIVQGYLYGKPMSVEDATDLLQSNRLCKTSKVI